MIEKILKELNSNAKIVESFIPARKGKPEQIEVLVKWLELRLSNGTLKARLHGQDLGQLSPADKDAVEVALTARRGKAFEYRKEA